MENLILYGAGDLGLEYLWFIKQINRQAHKWNVLGFVDDFLPVGAPISTYSVLGGADWLKMHTKEINVVCSVSNPAVKRKIVEQFVRYPWVKFPVLVHPSSVISDDLKIGRGSVIAPNCVVSVDVEIGKHVIVNQNTGVSHHVHIGDYSMIAPSCSLGGHVKIGNSANLGIGCTVKPEARIGDNAVLGAGAVVVNDIPSDCVAVGIPAKPIKDLK